MNEQTPNAEAAAGKVAILEADAAQSMPEISQAPLNAKLQERIAELERQLADANRFLANESLSKRNAELEAENAALKPDALRFWQMQEEGLVTLHPELGTQGYRIETCNGITTRMTDERREKRKATIAAIKESEAK